MTDRRQFLRGAAGALGLWATPGILRAQAAGKVSVVNAGGVNLVALPAGNGIVLVDSGGAGSRAQVMSTLSGLAPNAKVQTLFNTHYHLDQTGNNEAFGSTGAKIIAHDRTRQWMSMDYWVPAEERYEPARPKAARPTETFETTGALRADTEEIEYGYLPLAHTNGDIYVFFRTSNLLVVGDVASPERDPELDYFTGAWIGGRVDAMDIILKLSNERTRIVPSYGRVMTRAEFQAERDVMEVVRSRLWKEVREGKSPKEMLDGGLMNGLSRTWKDPYKFLYDAAKGMWAHHNKLDHNVV
ncbi:MAG TPA: MBL fold metallo-hydrolase [Terriglobia bacterium]|nr:MBL fold metallo-hydrolase [Terriglobia bacterium]